MSMSSDQSGGQTPRSEPGNPPDLHAETPAVRAIQAAVKAMETHRGYIERDLNETRSDMRDVRDRLARLEVKVGDLPSKVWIGTVVVGGFVLLGVIVSLLGKLMGH